jgi:hypothetical protein
LKRYAWIFALLGAGVVIGVGGLLALWQFLAPSDRRVSVPYNEFIEEVHAGRVMEIRVHGRDIDYRFAPREGHTGLMQHTVGPVPDQAFIDTLKPTSSSDQPPRLYFEK